MILDRRTALSILAALPVVLLLCLAPGLLLSRLSHPGEPWRGLASAAVLGSFPLLFAASGTLLWLYLRWRRPAALQVAGGAFVAPPAHAVTVATVASVCAVAMIILPRRLTMGPSALTLFYVAFCGLLLALCAVNVAAVVRSVGLVELRPEGLSWVDLTGTTSVPWEAVTAGPGPIPGPLGASQLTGFEIAVTEPGAVRRRGTGSGLAPSRFAARSAPHRVAVPTLSTAADRRFLAAAVAHYLRHPAERAAIGTPEGYDRLLAALRGGR